MGLTPRQSRFKLAYLKSGNATQAAIEAGYSPKTAASQGQRLLKNVEVRKAVEGHLGKLELSADEILGELLRIGRADIGLAFDGRQRLKPLKDIPEDVRRAISGVEVVQLFEGHGDGRYHSGDLMKVKFWEKTKALELLAKHMGLLIERHKHELSATLEQLVEASLKKPEGIP